MTFSVSRETHWTDELESSAASSISPELELISSYQSDRDQFSRRTAIAVPPASPKSALPQRLNSDSTRNKSPITAWKIEESTPQPPIPIQNHQRSNERFDRRSAIVASTFLEQSTPAPPNNPLPWMWACHLCGRRYHLSATSRCLEDGHRFCSGTTITKRKTGKKKVVRHKPCTSEFDYAGWKVYGNWRREFVKKRSKFAYLADGEVVSDSEMSDAMSLGEDVMVDRKKRGHSCWLDCDFPSECRWGSKLGYDIVEAKKDFDVGDQTPLTVMVRRS